MNISKNIAIMQEYDDAIFFKSICGCLAHSKTLCLEMNDAIISLTIYADYVHFDSNSSFLRKIGDRIKNSLSILFFGKLELHDDFIFSDEKSIQCYIQALQEGLNKLKTKSIVNENTKSSEVKIGDILHVENAEVFDKAITCDPKQELSTIEFSEKELNQSLFSSLEETIYKNFKYEYNPPKVGIKKELPIIEFNIQELTEILYNTYGWDKIRIFEILNGYFANGSRKDDSKQLAKLILEQK